MLHITVFGPKYNTNLTKLFKGKQKSRKFHFHRQLNLKSYNDSQIKTFFIFNFSIFFNLLSICNLMYKLLHFFGSETLCHRGKHPQVNVKIIVITFQFKLDKIDLVVTTF